MSSNIKYNEFGEVISVNGITTGHHLGAPMQDAIGTPEENSPYGTEIATVSRLVNVVEDNQPLSGEPVVDVPELPAENINTDVVYKAVTKTDTDTVIAYGIPNEEGNKKVFEHKNPEGWVELGAGGGVTSWNDLTDKPFGEYTIERIVWDGNTDGKEMVWVSENACSVMVSEKYFTADQLIGGRTYTSDGDCFDITEDSITVIDGGFVVNEDIVIVSAPSDLFAIPGTYFLYVNDGAFFDTELAFPSPVKGIEKIDEKYLPYVVITGNKGDGSLSCNVSDFFTLVTKLDAYPLMFYRRIDSDGFVVFQELLGAYSVLSDCVVFYKLDGLEECRFYNDGTITANRE